MRDLSILPEEFVERRIQRRTNLVSLMLFGVVMSGVVGAYFVTDQQRRDVKALQKEVNTHFEEAAKRLEQLEELQKRKEAMIYKAQVSGALIERVPRSVILAELINNMPATVSLTEFGLQTKVVQAAARASTALQKAKNDQKKVEPTAPEVPKTEVTLSLVGMAPTDVEVAQFMTALGECPMFRDINLLFSEEDTLDDTQVRRFRVEMMLNPNVDLKNYEPTKVSRFPNQNPMGDTFQIDPEGKMVLPKKQVQAGD
ncbi:MAG: PilN domain-containing protein [Phycisphaeraceae bacterium]|nr:PilN domain-containing protein [Phycisphaeraceae bacterium]